MKKVCVLIPRLQFKVSVIVIFLENHPQNEAPSMPVDDTVQTEQQLSDDDKLGNKLSDVYNGSVWTKFHHFVHVEIISDLCLT